MARTGAEDGIMRAMDSPATISIHGSSMGGDLSHGSSWHPRGHLYGLGVLPHDLPSTDDPEPTGCQGLDMDMPWDTFRGHDFCHLTYP